MFKDEAAILQAAATLAAADRTAVALARNSAPGPVRGAMGQDLNAVERLLNVLRQMEREGLIPSGLAPPPTQPGP